MRFIAAAAFIMGSTALVRAAQQDAASPWIETRFERVHLRNGNTIDGHLVREGKSSLLMKLRIGEMEIPRGMIERVEKVRMRSLKEVAAEERPRPKPEPAAPLPVEPTVEKTPEPGTPFVRPPAEFAAGVPLEVREQIDQTIHTWANTPSHLRGNLSQTLEPLSEDGVRYLCALLDEKPVRRIPVAPVCDALGRKKDPSSIPSLARVLEDGLPLPERTAAIKALAAIGAPACLDPLLRALEDKSASVWRPAVEGVAAIAKSDPRNRIVDQLLSVFPKTSQKATYALALAAIGGDDAYRGLVYFLRSSDDAERFAALQGLSTSLAPSDADLVMPCLYSASNIVRREACLVLGNVKHKGAVKDLIELLGEEDIGLVTNAHKALQEITGELFARDANLWRTWWELTGKQKFSR